jgi:hypothetical protein
MQSLVIDSQRISPFLVRVLIVHALQKSQCSETADVCEYVLHIDRMWRGAILHSRLIFIDLCV